RGIAVTLVERHRDFAREFRGEVLMPSGLDAFAQMGLAPALGAVPQTTIEAIEVYRGTRRLMRVDEVAVLGIEPRVVSQPAMLEMLVAEAGRHAAFRLERGTTVRDLVWDGERVAGVRVDSGDGGREIRGDLVIGTDGL